jgi:hypothetical protein
VVDAEVLNDAVAVLEPRVGVADAEMDDESEAVLLVVQEAVAAAVSASI